MKNKITRTLTAFCAALLLMGGFSVPAFAQTPEDTPDATDDSGVVVEEPQEAEPLTPEGNATLVDDFGGNKQLITVTTKAGNYFYILIDRDDEGENTVHFLNQVDDADLSALLEDGETTTETPAVCNCTEKCEAGAVNINCPVCSADRSQCAGKEPEPGGTGNPAGGRKRRQHGATAYRPCACRGRRRGVLLFQSAETEEGHGKGKRRP